MFELTTFWFQYRGKSNFLALSKISIFMSKVKGEKLNVCRLSSVHERAVVAIWELNGFLSLLRLLRLPFRITPVTNSTLSAKRKGFRNEVTQTAFYLDICYLKLFRYFNKEVYFGRGLPLKYHCAFPTGVTSLEHTALAAVKWRIQKDSQSTCEVFVKSVSRIFSQLAVKWIHELLYSNLI